MFWRRRTSRPVDCYLVYGREEPNGDEPLLEVVATEDEAFALEVTVERQIPNLKIQWQPVPWHRNQGSTPLQSLEKHLVHVVLEGLEDNETGLGVFDNPADADSMVAKHVASGAEVHRRTVRLGQWLSGKYSIATDD